MEVALGLKLSYRYKYQFYTNAGNFEKLQFDYILIIFLTIDL